MTQEKEPSRDIRCEFCGEFFENRKGLSSHARSHLRHMGITEWSVNGSPIDTLWEVMRIQGTTPASVALGIKEEPGQDGGISLNSPGYQSSALSRKSPLNLLHSGSRLHKHGLGSIALSSTSPVGKIFGVPSLKKKVLVEEGQPGGKALLIQSKNVSPPPQDYSFKGKASVEKHGVGHMGKVIFFLIYSLFGYCTWHCLSLFVVQCLFCFHVWKIKDPNWEFQDLK